MPEFDRTDRIRFGMGLAVLVVLLAAISLHGALRRPMAEPVWALPTAQGMENSPQAQVQPYASVRFGLDRKPGFAA